MPLRLSLEQIMMLHHQVGALQATSADHERRIRMIEKERKNKGPPSWLTLLPVHEAALIAFLLLAGIAMHLMPEATREDLRAIITARANK